VSVRVISISVLLATNRRSLNARAMPIESPSKRNPYIPPQWAIDHLSKLPQHGRLNLANFPTPLQCISSPSSHERRRQGSQSDNEDSDGKPSVLQRLWELNISLFIKRDDMSGGVELGGNKVRKLEFLLAEALEENFDAAVTIGGEQSNHCRATAAACRAVGLDPHLILRTRRANDIYDSTKNEKNGLGLGYIGNILFDRLVGSKIYTCTPGEYGRVGSDELVSRLCKYIERKENKKVYAIPVGGSNALGSWGYIEGVQEVMKQLNAEKMDHIVFASGSGGTAAGITLGITLAHGLSHSNEKENSIRIPELHAIGVCDNPDYFYETVANIADDMGLYLSPIDKAPHSMLRTEEFIRKYLTVHQGKGLGYASSTQEELSFVTQFALETGIVLDPVYSGKALYHFVTSVLEEDPEKYKDSNIMFWHTGGALGMFDKGDSFTFETMSPVSRIDIYGTDDDSGKVCLSKSS